MMSRSRALCLLNLIITPAILMQEPQLDWELKLFFILKLVDSITMHYRNHYITFLLGFAVSIGFLTYLQSTDFLMFVFIEIMEFKQAENTDHSGFRVSKCFKYELTSKSEHAVPNVCRGVSRLIPAF